MYTEETTNAIQRVLELSRGILQGNQSVLQAARELSSLRNAIAGAEGDPDFLTFVGIYSETDSLPVGRESALWAAEALAEKDIEIQKAEIFYLDTARAAAKNLIARYEKAT
jgi:hypothetical protein